jgi:acyl-CoA thioesterase II
VEIQPEALLELLDLSSEQAGTFSAQPPRPWLPRVFGGQLLAQALCAASRSLGSGVCHSLHASFLRAAQAGRPIEYRPALVRDGRTFIACEVTAVQDDELKMHFLSSFERQPADGAEHQQKMPDAPAPESFGDEATRVGRLLERAPEWLHASIRRQWPFEFITIDEWMPDDTTPRPTRIRTWMRAREPLPDDANLQRCALAYASDMLVLDPSMNAIGVDFGDPDLQLASLDHSLWFHRNFHAGDWMLFDCDTTTVAGGRGFNRGAVYDRGGQLIASMTQEVLLRKRVPTVMLERS